MEYNGGKLSASRVVCRKINRSRCTIYFINRLLKTSIPVDFEGAAHLSTVHTINGLLRLRRTPYSVLYQSGMFLGVSGS